MVLLTKAEKLALLLNMRADQGSCERYKYRGEFSSLYILMNEAHCTVRLPSFHSPRAYAALYVGLTGIL
jgi:hypothetical protein